MFKRYLLKSIAEICFDADKMAFISGPRQCGKTTLTKLLLEKRGAGVYWNWDSPDVKRKWARNPALALDEAKGQKSKPLVVFDEIHKAGRWKNSLKGFYDSLTDPTDIVVTGSSKLNVYRRGGDSLMGRYYHFRLSPFSLGELLNWKAKPEVNDLPEAIFQGSREDSKEASSTLTQLLEYGAFPEPFLKSNKRNRLLWQRNRLEKLIREDLRDLSRVQELSQVETLCLLLNDRVASPCSVRSLQEELLVSYDSVQRWLTWLDQLYYSFELKPYSKNIARSLRKEGKRYLWDYSTVKEAGPRFENSIAYHLKKACDFWNDTGEGVFDLLYLRDKEKNELDFLITQDNKPWLALEAKTSDVTPSPAWRKFLPPLGCKYGIQLVLREGVWRKYEESGCQVLVASASRVLPFLV